METRTLATLGCALAALSMTLPANAGEGKGALPFEQLARGWYQTHVADLGGPADSRATSLDYVLEHRLTHVRLGAFQVLVPPASLVDRQGTDGIAATFESLLRVQEQWLTWMSDDGSLSAGDRETLETIESWLKTWNRRLPSNPSALAGVDLFTALAADDGVRTALEDLSDRLSSGAGLELSPPRTARLILMPSRRDFIGFVSFLGWKLESWRGSYWADGLRTWSDFDFAGTRILSLELSAADGDPLRGVALNAKNPRGLEEHVAQLAARSLLDAYFGDRMEPALGAALANSLVIDGWGEVDTRTDGDLRARDKAARSIFVPGGNPNGGRLPPQNADSRWREGKGEDHFVKALRKALQASQKKSRRGSRRKDASTTPAFLLCSDDESDRVLVHAPFLLGGSQQATRPSEFSGDYSEFLRAYHTAFVYWLREHAEGSPKKSRTRFAQFLETLATAAEANGVSGAIASVYEAPLSAAEMDGSSIEGRFVLWLRGR